MEKPIPLTKASRWRLAIARDIAEVYANEPNARAILVGGSVGHRRSDKYSDTEFGVFWAELPDEEQQRRIVEKIGGFPRHGYYSLEHTEPGRGYAPFVIGDTQVIQAENRIVLMRRMPGCDIYNIHIRRGCQFFITVKVFTYTIL